MSAEEDGGTLQELNAIERRLLLQIYAQFHRKDLPLSSFRLIREEISLRRMISVICALFACTVVLLVFHTGIGSLLSSLPAPTFPGWLVQLQIFTRLREINYLVNLRLAQSNKHIRFVYAISDERLCKVEHYKFFDYILPIIPYLNQKSVEVVLEVRLMKINRSLGRSESGRMVDIVRKVSPHLKHFKSELLFELLYRTLRCIY